MNEEVIQIGGLKYRIDWSPAHGWLVLVGSRVAYQGTDNDDCVRWIHAHAEQEKRVHP